jgi:hypothetical protein
MTGEAVRKMSVALFIPPGSTFLADYWLGTQAPSSGVSLVHFPEQGEATRALATKFSCVTETRALVPRSMGEDPAPPVPETLLVVPLQPRPFLLRHFKPHMLPDLVPHYDLFRDLWWNGFREFEVFHLGGGKRLSLPHVLDEFEGRHRGQRCFIVGNGPSLNDIDMTRLENEIAFGSNRCYLGYEKWGFAFKYWAIADWLQMEEYREEYERAIPPETIKFFPFDYLAYFRFEQACPVRVTLRNMEIPKFSGDKEWIHLGTTVTYFLLQIAVVMGCDPIILVGVDHRYPLTKSMQDLGILKRAKGRIKRGLERNLEGTFLHDLARAYDRVKAERRILAPPPQQDPSLYWTASDAAQPTHFDSGYSGGAPKRFRVPIPEWAERQFDLAAKWGREKGVTILNATPGTALESFEKVRYEDLF